MENITVWAIDLLVLAVAVGIVVFFVTSLVRLCKTPKDDPKHGNRVVRFVVSCVPMLLLLCALGFFVMLMFAVANM